MICYQNIELKKQTLIDFVIMPLNNVNFIIDQFIETELIVFFDTVGNFNIDQYSSFNSLDTLNSSFVLNSSFDANSSFLDRKNVLLKYQWISSIHNLYFHLRNLPEDQDFVLIIDSITFICDFDFQLIQQTIRILWETIYNKKCTIVTVNHFKIEIENLKTPFIPRMGIVWTNFVSYQITLKINESKIKINKKHLFLNNGKN